MPPKQAENIVDELLLKFSPSSNELTALQSSLDVCCQAVKIIKSRIEFIQQTKQCLDGHNLVSSVFSSDMLFDICEFLENHKEIVNFRQINKMVHGGLIGYPLKLEAYTDPQTFMKLINEISKLRINRSIIPSKFPCCDCIASNFVNLAIREFPEQLALCPLKYSKVSTKNLFSPTISELKSIGYYQPWTISKICLDGRLLDGDIDRILELDHLLNLKSLTISGRNETRLPKSLLVNLDELKIYYYQQDLLSLITPAALNLKSLLVASCQYPFHIKTLTALVRLEFLSLQLCPNLQGNIDLLTSFRCLKRLFLNSSNLTGNISSFSNFNGLMGLSVTKCFLIHGNISSLSNLTKLKMLTIQLCENILGDLSYLSNLHLLQHLEIINQSITGDIRSLIGMSHLTTLDIYDTRISGDLVSLSSLKNLKSLGCGRTAIEGKIDSLSSLTKLEKLIMNSTNVKGDVSSFIQLLRLKCLVLDSCSGIYGDIVVFPSLPSLQQLFVPKTKVHGKMSSLSCMLGVSININGTQIEYDV